MTPPTTTSGGRSTTDGRHARSDRSRVAVAEALLSLVNEGVIRPTAEQISARAGVSIRSVFRHTADAEQLNEILVDLHISRTSDLFDLPPMDPSKPDRVTALVAHRRALYETITPVRRAVRVHGPFGDVLRSRVEEVNELLRSQLPTVFAPEIAERSPAAAHLLLEALEVATSWSSWEHLRSDQSLSAERAERVIVHTVTALVT